MRTPLRIQLFLVPAVLAVTACAGATQALALAPHWSIVARTAPSTLKPGEQGQLNANILNLGDAAALSSTGNPFVIADVLPAGVEATGPMVAGTGEGSETQGVKCAVLPTLRCEVAALVPPLLPLSISIPVRTAQEGDLGENEVKIEGGNAPPTATRQALKGASGPITFGVERYELKAEAEDGSPELQAGSHPFQLTTTLLLNQTLEPDIHFPKVVVPGVPELLRNVATILPAGLVASTTAIPRCSDVDFSTIRSGQSDKCAPNTAVGAVVVTFKEPNFLPAATETVPLFNLTPAQGEPARFGFEFDSVPVTLDTSIRTGEGYAAEVHVSNASQAAEVMSTVLTVWGVPGDPRHDSARGWECLGRGHFVKALEPRPPCQPLGQSQPPAYLTMPTTACGLPLSTTLAIQSWKVGAPLLPPVEATSPQALEGCSSLPFDPSITVTPDQRTTSTPTGLTVEVKVPQDTTVAANGLAEADIQATEVALPDGLQASAGAADGLETCSVGAAGFSGSDSDTGPTLEAHLAEQRFSPAAASCPNASKIGEVSIHSPLLENDVHGFVYIGQQNTDPFASPLAIYLMAEDPVSGVRVKLVGEVKLSESGQLITVFRNAPPLPFDTLKLHLFDGPRASQATPPFCHSYTTRASFVPWSGQPAVERSSSFTPEAGPNGTACQSSGPLPFAPGFHAGSVSNQAGAFTPFSLTIERPDGNQALQAITMHLPPGAAAMLSSVTPCPEPQASQNECGPASLIGHSTASSGLGPNPVTLGGDVYLTGPYKGAPFGLLAVTHAKAGPFNLGDIPVRSTINVDQTTAAATIVSDPLPQIVKGAPAQIKRLNVVVDRPGFEFNPTNCAPMQVTGALAGYEGGATGVSSPFQVSNCAALPFKPTLTAEIEPNVSRVDGTGLVVKVKANKGDANIHKTKLLFPTTVPSRLTTIQKACDDHIFNVNPANCPEGSVIGTAVAHTPVLKAPLVGPAYLVSHANASFPDAEFVLQGEGIKLVLDGKTDIKKGITSSTFETVPDAPVDTFEVKLPRGPHSAFSGFGDLCATPQNLPTEFVGQNGVTITSTTKAKLVNSISTGGSAVCGVTVVHKTELQKLLAKCKKLKNHTKRVKCEATARKQVKAVATCKKKNKSHKAKMSSCITKARKTFALKLK